MQARLAILLVTASALIACERTGAPSVPTVPRSSALPIDGREDRPEEQRSPDLYGAWVVEAIASPDRTPLENYNDMILLVGARQLEVLSQCVTFGPFDYGRTVGGGITVRQPSATRILPTSDGARPPPVQCARMLSPAEQALPGLLFSARPVRRNPDGSLTLSGGGGTMEIRRPAGALDNPRGEAPPPPRPPLLGAWRFVSIDGHAVGYDERMELLLRPQYIEWQSGCVNEVRQLDRNGDMLMPGASDAFPVCERGRSEAEIAVEKLFAAPIAADMGRKGRLTLAGSGVTAELVPLTR